ncbi:hypothetical protein V1511DRAFT_503237 [Dipodascopsis uninucleata]
MLIADTHQVARLKIAYTRSTTFLHFCVSVGLFLFIHIAICLNVALIFSYLCILLYFFTVPAARECSVILLQYY